MADAFWYFLEMQQIVRDTVKAGIVLARRRRWKENFRRAINQEDCARVAVGCGSVQVPGWISTDVSRHTNCWLDLLQPWPVPPGRVVRIYGDNVIEHFTLPEARRVLRFAFDALAPRGRIRLTTPDVERTAHAYLHDPALTSRHLQRHRDRGYLAEHPVDMLRVTFAESGHHVGYMYDFASLAAELRRAGFVDVTRCESGESADPNFIGLESRGTETEVATSLVVEAEKPPVVMPLQ